MLGLVVAAVALLVMAAVPKLADPLTTWRAILAARLPGRWPRWTGRVLGVAELAVAAIAVLTGTWGLALLAVSYLVLAGVAYRLRTVGGGADCGCFGQAASPASWWHVGVNLAFAVVTAGAAVAHTRAGTHPVPLWRQLLAQPWWGAPLLALGLVLAYGCTVLLTAFGDLLQARTGPAAVRPVTSVQTAAPGMPLTSPATVGVAR